MSWDLLIEWVGESGSGSWISFKDACQWLGMADPATARPRPHEVALTLSGLGHMEIDWDLGEWNSTEPLITLLPRAGGSGLLAGGRTRHLMDRLEQEISRRQDVVMVRHKQEGPTAVFFQSGFGALESLCTKLGIDFEFNLADRVSRVMPSLSALLSLGSTPNPPPSGFEIDRWAAPSWETTTEVSRDGLYQRRSFGRRTYWFVEGGRFCQVDGPTGFYAELCRLRRHPLGWRQTSVSGTLFRPVWAPLPLLQERAATFCSGLAPRVADPLASPLERRFRYENVPRAIAEDIAKSLSTKLEIL